MNRICNEKCQESLFNCILNCSDEDLNCLSECNRDEAACTNGKFMVTKAYCTSWRFCHHRFHGAKRRIGTFEDLFALYGSNCTVIVKQIYDTP